MGVFPKKPTDVIEQINNQHLYNYDTWRIPTAEELALLRANNYLGSSVYMSTSTSRVSGIVLLVTDAKETYTQRIEREAKEQAARIAAEAEKKAADKAAAEEKARLSAEKKAAREAAQIAYEKELAENFAKQEAAAAERKALKAEEKARLAAEKEAADKAAAEEKARRAAEKKAARGDRPERGDHHKE